MDLRDLEYWGKDIQDFKEITSAELKVLLNDATNWLNSKSSVNPKSGKKPKGLRRWKIGKEFGPRFVRITDGKKAGQLLVLHKEGLHATTQTYTKYMSKLTQASGIPRGIWKQLQSDSGSLLNEILPEDSPLRGRYPEGFEFTFKKWFNEFVGNQKTEQQFWRNLGQLYVDAGLEKDKFRRFPEMDRSHWWPKHHGGDPFTFLENWLINQSRGATPFTTRDRLQKLGIPTNWEELIEGVYQQEVNNKLTPIGKYLEDFSGYEAGALMRGIEPEEIISWNKRISDIQDEALQFPERIPDLQPEYTETILKYRGPGNEFGLEGKTKFLQDLDSGIEIDPEDAKRNPLYTETDLNADTDLIRDRMNKGGGGGAGPETKFSPNPLKRTLQIGGGLGIGSKILDAGSTLAKESPYSLFNRETASNVGQGLATYQDTGEVDMDNVKGAAAGFGKDLAFGAVTGGGLKAAFKAAATKGATHFGAKSLVGKAVPYVGWGMLAYGLYDTADAFVEGLTKKGISERIGEQYNNIIEEAFSPENSFFKQRKVEPEHDIQGTL